MRAGVCMMGTLRFGVFVYLPILLGWSPMALAGEG